MTDWTDLFYMRGIYLSCHTLPAFYGKEYFRIGRDSDLILDNVIAGANLTSHLCVPVFDVPLQSVCRYLCRAKYRQYTNVRCDDFVGQKGMYRGRPWRKGK